MRSEGKMDQGGHVLELNSPGPRGGVAFAIVDYTTRTISYVEVLPNQQNKIVVWEVQPDYTKPGG
jgi:hypothetical protein